GPFPNLPGFPSGKRGLSAPFILVRMFCSAVAALIREGSGRRRRSETLHLRAVADPAWMSGVVTGIRSPAGISVGAPVHVETPHDEVLRRRFEAGEGDGPGGACQERTP